MTKTLIAFSNVDKQHFWEKFDDKCGFYNWGPCAFLKSCLDNLDNLELNNSVKPKKNSH